MKAIHFRIYTFLLASSLFCFSGCTNEMPNGSSENTPEEEALVQEVPIDISIGTDWFIGDTDTKAAPPDAGETGLPDGTETDGSIDGTTEAAGTDSVLIVAFRRKDLDDTTTGGSTESFIFDPNNDQIVPCAKENASDHRMKAHGTLKKTYGYEYRVIAIAYDGDKALPYSGVPGSTDVYKTDGEGTLFSVNLLDGVTYEDFTATINNGDVWESFLNGDGSVTHNTKYLSKKLAYSPQFFYGFCHTGDENPIIKYATEDADGNLVSNVALTGVLYRGMAKVEVRLTVEQYQTTATVYRDIIWLGLLADTVYTQVSLSDYDDFLTPKTPITASGDNGSYTLVDFQDDNNNTGDNYSNGQFVVGKTVVLTAYLLPTKTHLGVRIRNTGNLGNSVHNCQIKVADTSFADNATGVISPDAQDNIFYLRRNHKYVFTGTISTLKSNELE